MSESFTAPAPTEGTQPATTPIESKRELLYQIRRLGTRGSIGLAERLTNTNTAVWPDPEAKKE